MNLEKAFAAEWERYEQLQRDATKQRRAQRVKTPIQQRAARSIGKLLQIFSVGLRRRVDSEPTPRPDD